MEFAYDLGGGSTTVLKKYHVAATNAVVGRPYLKTADGGVGVVLGTVSGAVDFIGVNIDAPGTYAAGQNSDGSENAKTVTLIINPLAVYKARLSGGATDGTALTAHTVTTASTDGLTATHSAFDVSSPDLDEGTIWGYSGANAGIARKITGTSTTATTVILAFPRDDAVGDQYLHCNVHPTRSILVQLTTNCTEVDATAALSSDATAVTTELLLNDIAGNGTTTSYAFIQFCDSLFGATVT